MQKIMVLKLLAIASLGSLGFAYAGTMGPMNQDPNWKGFYLGGNVGGWWTQNQSISTNGVISHVDGVFPDLAINVAEALAEVGTNELSTNSGGFIGGGQIGYNLIYNNRFLIGADADINGLTQSNNTVTVNKSVALPPDVVPTENYSSEVSIMRTIDYIGTVRGRVGYLFKPTMLIYGKGGFAYGGVPMNTYITAIESAGADIYPPIHVQYKTRQTRAGWTAGGGLEWMFHSNWSANIEYAYYDLGTVKNSLTLAQSFKRAIPPIAQYGAAKITTSAPISIGSFHLGLNYHFANL